MPQYSFKCDNCNTIVQKTFSIPEFLEFKSNKNICLDCASGSMVLQVSSFGSKVEKSMPQIKQSITEEVKSIAKKINKGDEQTFVDIYGDKPNTHKQRINGDIDGE